MTPLDRFHQFTAPLIEESNGDKRVWSEQDGAALYEAVAQHGSLDHGMIDTLRRAIFQGGDPSSAYIGRIEADLLFRLNESIDNKGGNWVDLLIDGITAHVLNDAGSDGEIDNEEAEWLINRIENDKQYDSNEIALLEHLLAQADRIPQSLRFRLGLVLSIAHGGG